MKHVLNTIFLGLISIGLLNCSNKKADNNICPHYYANSAKSTQDSNNRISEVEDDSFSSKEPGCEASALEYGKMLDEIETIISSSRNSFENSFDYFYSSDDQCAPQVKTNNSNLNKMSTYYNDTILTTESADYIRRKIFDLADKAFVKASCKDKIHTKTIYIVENKDVSIPKNAPITKIIVSDLQIDLKDANTVILNGTNQTITKKKVCKVELKDVAVSNTEFVVAAENVSILNSDIVCEMAQSVDSSLGSNYSPRTYALVDATDKSIEGYLGCMYNKRMYNNEKFETILKSILKSQPQTCEDR